MALPMAIPFEKTPESTAQTITGTLTAGKDLA